MRILVLAGIELPDATPMDLACDAPDPALGPREALRLRVRWVQELSARVAWELGTRMIAARKIKRVEHKPAPTPFAKKTPEAMCTMPQDTRKNGTLLPMTAMAVNQPHAARLSGRRRPLA